jgi:hypothetical protein
MTSAGVVPQPKIFVFLTWHGGRFYSRNHFTKKTFCFLLRLLHFGGLLRNNRIWSTRVAYRLIFRRTKSAFRGIFAGFASGRAENRREKASFWFRITKIYEKCENFS